MNYRAEAVRSLLMLLDSSGPIGRLPHLIRLVFPPIIALFSLYNILAAWNHHDYLLVNQYLST